MPLGAIIGAIAGIGASVLGSAGQDASNRAQSKEAEKQAKKRYERDLLEYELSNQAAEAQYYWDVARVEQLRFNERQKESDYYGYQNGMIAAAANQLNVRIDGLQRSTDVRLQGLESRNLARIDALQGESSSRMTEISTRAMIENQQEAARASVDYSSRMQALTIETLEAARQYLNQSNQVAIEANQLVSRINLETEELIQSLALEEQRDYLGWQLNKIAALVDGSQQGNAAVVRQGGGTTSKRLMQEAAKKLGRSWGELEIRTKSRDVRLGLLNSTIKGQYAQQMGRYALQTQDLADRTASTLKRSDAESKSLSDALTKITIPGLMQRAQLAGVQMQGVFAGAKGQLGIIKADNTAARNEALADLTNAKQAAFADFGSNVASLSRPFRQEEFFDPLKPIPGLAPEYVGPTQPAKSNPVLTIGNAILGGVQGAMQFSYKKADGSLAFY